MKGINSGHFLMGVRADTWFRLLRENRFAVRPEQIPQALLISATSTLLSPVAALEKAVFDKRIMASRPEKDPIFVLGHWRSGTTYLQNMLSRDEQFGWFDPVNTVVLPYSLLLGKILTPAVKKGIANGRPMDNVQYSLDLPMEETFALLTQTDHDIIHMIAFPGRYESYLSGAFVEDLSPEELAKWRKAYDYIIRKLTYIKGGKQLILKSPDNTGHIPELRSMYPDARYINIHRDPYKTIRSTIHMFTTQMDSLALTLPPADVDIVIEDTIISIFERMYRQLFELEKTFPDNRYADVAFTDFTRDPVGMLREIYRKLELPGFEAAEPRFRAYADSQKNYKKNRLELSPRLIRKINARLGFYFEHYGYDRMEAEEGMTDHLSKLESKSVHILREAYAAFGNLCMLWSIGKDSTVLLWLARKAFYGHVPFPLVHIDTHHKIPEMIEYRDRLAMEYGLYMVYGENKDALDRGETFPDGKTSRVECCRLLKTEALTHTLDGTWPRYRLNLQTGKYERDTNTEAYTGVIVGARADEEGSRSKERYFSPRDRHNDWDLDDQPPEFWNQFKTDFAPGTHVRIHPLLDWTELNVWEYIEREHIPTVSLYYNQGNGMRYRSLGCAPCTGPIRSESRNPREIIEELRTGALSNIAERSGRAQDAEDGGGLETLRRGGYM